MPVPLLLSRKIYKTGQTRGADDDVIYQNRVSRNSTALIPFALWSSKSFTFPDSKKEFENGFIVLITPRDYFETLSNGKDLTEYDLTLGVNSLVFYETRKDWIEHNPEAIGWDYAKSRKAPLQGNYVARIPAITSEGGKKIMRGFTETSIKGAGIRVYEYASRQTIADCRLQLEAAYWLSENAVEAATENGMDIQEALNRKEEIKNLTQQSGLLDFEKLKKARIINDDMQTICPLCLEKIKAEGFFNRMHQAEGREVHNLTVTEVNLFHIEELRVGIYNHKPYNLGWGHHHCNVVVKDAGITSTLIWMQSVLDRNSEAGLLTVESLKI